MLEVTETLATWDSDENDFTPNRPNLSTLEGPKGTCLFYSLTCSQQGTNKENLITHNLILGFLWFPQTQADDKVIKVAQMKLSSGI